MKADIIFLLDTSPSIGQATFNHDDHFLQGFVKGFEIGPSAVQVGAVEYNGHWHNMFHLNSYNTLPTLLTGINNMQNPHLRLGNNVEGALDYVLHHGFQARYGDRPDAPNVLVYISDGDADDHRDAIVEAQHLRHENIEIIAIGVGRHVDMNMLRAVATDSRHVFSSPSLDSVHLLQSELQAAACRGE
jgi:uncharacterized protein YegL